MSALVSLLVVRHSERLDEVNEGEWKKIVQSKQGTRKSIKDDPIISPGNGIKYAAEVAHTLREMVGREARGREVRVYSSRLLRSVQTAVAIAQALAVPVYLCAGLSQIIPAVKKAGPGFQFASIEELRGWCPGVEFVDCDDRRSSNFVPTVNWRQATLHIVNNPAYLPIIVGHRESVRKLAGEYLQTPYCCIGVFEMDGRTRAGDSASAASAPAADKISSSAAATDSKHDDRWNDHKDLIDGLSLDEDEEEPAPSSSAVPPVRRKCGTPAPDPRAAAAPKLTTSNTSSKGDGADKSGSGSARPRATTGGATAGATGPVRKCGTAEPGRGAVRPLLSGGGRGGRAGGGADAGRGEGGGGDEGDDAKPAGGGGHGCGGEGRIVQELARLRLISVLDKDGTVVPQK